MAHRTTIKEGRGIWVNIRGTREKVLRKTAEAVSRGGVIVKTTLTDEELAEANLSFEQKREKKLQTRAEKRAARNPTSITVTIGATLRGGKSAVKIEWENHGKPVTLERRIGDRTGTIDVDLGAHGSRSFGISGGEEAEVSIDGETLAFYIEPEHEPPVSIAEAEADRYAEDLVDVEPEPPKFTEQE